MAHIQSPRFDGEDQQNLLGCGVCIDPEYNVLWGFSPCSGEVSCFNPIAADIEGGSFGRSRDTDGRSCDIRGGHVTLMVGHVTLGVVRLTW